jgi:TonB family protein
MRLLSALAVLTVASFTARDVAVIEAALNVVVPEFTEPLLVVNETLIPRAASRPVPPPLAAELDARNGEHRRIASLQLHRPMTLVDPAVKPAWSRHETRVVLSLPAYSADGSEALVEIAVTRPHEGWLEPIRETLLMKQHQGVWMLSQRRSLRLDDATPKLPLRVGGDVTAPVIISRVEPRYPPEAAKARIAGIVIIEAIIDEEGRVTDAQVLKPLPFGLDQAALDAVKQWRFRPGTLHGEPVPVIFSVTVNFQPPEPPAPPR